MKRFITEYLEENWNENLICLYQKRERAEWDTEDVYNIWLFEQISWCVMTKSWIDELEEFLKWYDNIQSADITLLYN